MNADQTDAGKSFNTFLFFSRILSLSAGIVLALTIDNPILSFGSVLMVGGLLELILMREEPIEA